MGQGVNFRAIAAPAPFSPARYRWYSNCCCPLIPLPLVLLRIPIPAFYHQQNSFVMKAAVFHKIGDISVDQVDDPVIEHPEDVIVQVTSIAGVCSSCGLVSWCLGGLICANH